MKKRILSLFLVVIMSFGFTSTAFAQEPVETESDYYTLWNELNEEYRLDLPLDYVKDDEITLAEFESMAREIMQTERDTRDYIAMREAEADYSEQTGISRATVTRTVTQKTWSHPYYFGIKASYTVVNGATVGKVTSSSIVSYTASTYLTSISSPSYTYLDAKRTAAVKYTAKIHFNGNLIGTSGTLYAEFYK